MTNKTADLYSKGNMNDEKWKHIVRSKLISDGVLPLIGRVDENFLESFLAPLEYLTTTEDENIKSVNLIINSPGGDATWIGRAMHLIANSHRPVIAYIDQACSAAFMISMSCHLRFCYPTSILMHHLAYTEVGGSGKELMLQASMADAIDDTCAQVLFDRTDITKEILSKHKDNNWWITPTEALKLGVVHELMPFQYALSEVSYTSMQGKQVLVPQSKPEQKPKRKRKTCC